MKESPDYEVIRAFKNRNAIELLNKYGAHSLGIRWKTEDGTKTNQLALAFYVDPLETEQTIESVRIREPIPSSFEFQLMPGEAKIQIPTEVILDSRPHFEEE